MADSMNKLAGIFPAINKRHFEETARKANNRGAFLSVLNRQVSGPIGEKIVAAFSSGNSEEFASLWGQISDAIVAEVKKKAGKETASVDVVTTRAKLEEVAKIGGKRVSLMELQSRFGKTVSMGKEQAEVAKLSEQIGRIRRNVIASLNGRTPANTEVAADQENMAIICLSDAKTVKEQGGIYVAVVEYAPGQEDDFDVVEDCVVADKDAAQTACDEYMQKYDLRPDQVVC